MIALDLGGVGLDVERLPDGAVRIVADPAGGEGVFAPGVWERLLSLSPEDVAALRAATGPWPPAAVVDLKRSVPARRVGGSALEGGLSPGDVVLIGNGDDTPDTVTVTAYGFGCPGCGARSILHIGTGPAGHTWHVTAGHAANPEGVTLRASILHDPQHGGCGWHGYLTEGRFSPC